MNCRIASVMLVAFGMGVASCADVLDVRTTRYPASADSRCVGTLRVRLFVDLTGPTHDVAESIGKGFTDHLHAIDAEGGIRGCRLDLIEADSKYDVETALSEYRGWASRPKWDEVSTIFGPDTRVTKALAPLTAADGKVFLTSALNGALAPPTAVDRQIEVPTLSGSFTEASVPVRKSGPGNPSVFFHGTDYTDPVDGAKTFLPELGGTKVGRDLAIELEDDEATVGAKSDAYAREELARAAEDSTYERVDWIWFGNTRSTLTYVGKALAVVKSELGYAPRVITNNWGIDEQLYEACGDDCAGMVGLHPYPMSTINRHGAGHRPRRNGQRFRRRRVLQSADEWIRPLRVEDRPTGPARRDPSFSATWDRPAEARRSKVEMGSP